MKVGDTRSDGNMMLVATLAEYTAGRLVTRHPRCGKVVFVRKPVDGNVADSGGDWVISACEKPDPEEGK